MGRPGTGGPVIDYADARRLLLLHSVGSDADGWLPEGFLGNLRPYRGLREENFHVVMEALLTVGVQLHVSPLVERDLVHALWRLCSTAWGTGLHPGGMLRRNHLITPEDLARLERWVDAIERTALRLLQGHPPEWVVHNYAEVVAADGWGTNAPFFVALMGRAITDSRIGDSVPALARALARLGPAASSILPVLYEAEQREYPLTVPPELFTNEVRAEVRRAIDAIEGRAGSSATG